MQTNAFNFIKVKCKSLTSDCNLINNNAVCNSRIDSMSLEGDEVSPIKHLRFADSVKTNDQAIKLEKVCNYVSE